MLIHQMTPEKWAKIDRFWLDVAIAYGDAFSKDPKHRFGSIILNNTTLAPCVAGYNGRGAGRPDVRISMEQGRAGTAHSEANAIGRMNWDWGCTYTLYVRSNPCYDCASLILNMPITRFVHRDTYEAERGDEELAASGRVEVIRLDPFDLGDARGQEILLLERELAIWQRLADPETALTINARQWAGYHQEVDFLHKERAKLTGKRPVDASPTVTLHED